MYKVCLVGINTPVLLPPGVEPSEHEREYFSTPSKEEAEKVFENLESLSEYISDIAGYEVDTSEVAVHAIAGYQEGGRIHIIHSRIREPEDLRILARTCQKSEIRIVFVTPDGGTFAEDVWSANISIEEATEPELCCCCNERSIEKSGLCELCYHENVYLPAKEAGWFDC